MKKMVYAVRCLAALAGIMLLTECSDNNELKPLELTTDEIQIAPSMAAESKSRNDNTSPYNGQLAVFCRDVENRANENQYFGDIATISNGVFTNWTNNGVHLWPKDKQMDFVAIGNFDSTKGIDGNVCRFSNGSKADFGWDYYHYFVDYYQTSIYDDLQVGVKHAQTNEHKPVKMTLLHALAGVKLKFTNNTSHLNIVIDGIEITNVPAFAYYYPPTDDSEWVEDWQTTAGNPETLRNNYRTGTWNNHVGDSRSNYVTIKPDFDSKFLESSPNTHECVHGQARLINEDKPFYLLPHYNFNSEGKKARIIFYVRIWDTQKQDFDNAALGTDGKIECDFVPSDKGTLGLGRMYTINYTVSGRGEISVTATVAAFANEDWSISAN